MGVTKDSFYVSMYRCPICNGKTVLDWDYDDWNAKDGAFVTCLDCETHVPSYVCDRSTFQPAVVC